ncbi:MAG: anthranilate phosphoribosyltransferase [Gemmatimonadota bacterium]
MIEPGERSAGAGAPAGEPRPGDVAALFREVLQRLGERRHLGERLTAEAMGCIMAGEVSPALVAGFLIGLRVKGETVDEIVGCARAIRSRARPFPTGHSGLVDTCGTGGDGADTFNVSTTAAFIVAGAGIPVAKHGNRAASSRAGSADVLEALGVEVGMPGPQAAGALEAAGVTFLFAPTFHAALRHAAPVRRELAVRTVFNLLGPLCNPAGAGAQVIGVSERALLRPLAEAAARLGAERVMVVHGSDGLDELTVTGPSWVAEWDGSRIREYTVEPQALRLPLRRADELRGGDAARNAAILRGILGGTDCEDGSSAGVVTAAAVEIALLNAAAALVVAQRASGLAEGLELARHSIESGSARERLDVLIAYSRQLRAGRDRRRRRDPPVPAKTAGWGR